jgi:hypothetical protein
MKYSRNKNITNEYPLIDLRLTREACRRIILDAGLPEPPKSACYFCPLQSPARWKELRHIRPDLFEAASKLETRLNEKRDAIGRDAVHLHPAQIPLDKAVGHQEMLWDDTSNCESGYCFT